MTMAKWHKKDDPAQGHLQSAMLETCRYNAYHFVRLALLNPEKQLSFKFIDRSPASALFINDPKVPMLEIWADRGHFKVRDYYVCNAFYRHFYEIRQTDLSWIDKHRFSVVHSFDEEERESL